jgi:hypothetical protein
MRKEIECLKNKLLLTEINSATSSANTLSK